MRGGSLIEQLEERALLAGNLRLVDAYLSDANGTELTSVAAGQVAYVQAEFRTTDLAAGDAYKLRVKLDDAERSVPLTLGAGVAGSSEWVQQLGTWLVPAGASLATVTLDADDDVSETDETDNARTFQVDGQTFAPKFVKPIGGEMGRDWAFVNYTDTDQEPETCTDPTGGVYCYDGHRGWDFVIANFHAMDEGHEVYAAAAGTVVTVSDGNFDRETTRGTRPVNLVTIDHGNGWRTTYGHFRKYSIEVRVGDPVVAGQKLGLVGSSGDSNVPHLHWAIHYLGRLVEPGVAPEAYLLWQHPYPDTLPSILDSGITNVLPGPEIAERPSRAEYFGAGGAQTVYIWNRIAGFKPTDTFTVRWFRPNGTQFGTITFNPNVRFGWWQFFMTLPINPMQGTWQAATLINGVERARHSFFVSPTLHPQARMYHSDAYFVDGRTTPFDYGSIVQGQGVRPTQTFTVRNTGEANLTTGNLAVPDGFTVTEGLTAMIPPGGSDTFSIRLDDEVPGQKLGFVSFTTNDPSAEEAVQSFRVEGHVRSIRDELMAAIGAAGDNIYLRRNGDATDVWVNIARELPPTLRMPARQVTGLLLDARGGDDSIALDFLNGNPLGEGGMIVHGGDGDDVIRFLNTTGAIAIDVATATIDDVPFVHGGVERYEAATTITALAVGDGVTVKMAGQGELVTLGGLTLGGGSARLDLGNNDLLITGGDPATIESLVLMARNGTTRWLGPGIGTSDATALIGLAVGTQGADVLVKFTHNGDANLDGVVNADDYFRIDSGFLNEPVDPLYAQGDFNYDGRINADDYFLVDSAFLGQSAALVGSTPAAAPASAARTAWNSSSDLLRPRRRKPTLSIDNAAVFETGDRAARRNAGPAPRTGSAAGDARRIGDGGRHRHGGGWQ